MDFKPNLICFSLLNVQSRGKGGGSQASDNAMSKVYQFLCLCITLCFRLFVCRQNVMVCYNIPCPIALQSYVKLMIVYLRLIAWVIQGCLAGKLSGYSAAGVWGWSCSAVLQGCGGGAALGDKLKDLCRGVWGEASQGFRWGGKGVKGFGVRSNLRQYQGKNVLLF